MNDKFSPHDLDNAQTLLKELFNQVYAEESDLSGGTELEMGASALQGLRDTKVTFGNPVNNLVHLTRKLFDDVGVELTEIRKRQMREQFDFYYMTLAAFMKPKRGAQFTRVECSLNFGPKGEGEPIIQAIFPKSEWRPVLNWGGGMKLALDANLEWSAGISLPDGNKIQDLPGHLKTNVANDDMLKAHVVVPDYTFKLGRAEITATGEGNSECYWRIEKPDVQEMQTAQFGIVFKVPKAITSIELTGLIAAEPSMSWLVANIRDVIDGLSEKLQDLLCRTDEARKAGERLPIGAHEKWIITLPS